MELTHAPGGIVHISEQVQLEKDTRGDDTLISSQMMPKSIASCSFSGTIIVPHYYFQGQKGQIYWGFFQVKKVQFKL